VQISPVNSLIFIGAVGTFEGALEVRDHEHGVHESGWMDVIFKIDYS
jgi:hypothetical protein